MCADCNNEVTGGKPEAFRECARGMSPLFAPPAPPVNGPHLEGKRDWEVHGLPRR